MCDRPILAKSANQILLVRHRVSEEAHLFVCSDFGQLVVFHASVVTVNETN